ncbi:acetyltransferase, partial [Aspergillus uvarum CBS 121591]
PAMDTSDYETEKAKMLRGELYRAFTPGLIAARHRCKVAVHAFNNAGIVSRRRQVELWRAIVEDARPLPPPAPTLEEDEALFEHDPWVESPIRMDYGFNVSVGAGTFINFNCTIIDTCRVVIGERCLFGPNVSLYTGLHPLDGEVRKGTAGPEWGKEIHIGDDCWLAGDVKILAGVTVGKGSTVGAGSVDVPPYCVVVGNPARVLRYLKGSPHYKEEGTSG